MSAKVHYTHCPVCENQQLHKFGKITDVSVSKENFELWQCDNCQLRFTQDVPDELSINRYYQSPDYISHTNTNKGAVNKIYHLVRQFTLNQKSKLIAKQTKLKTGKILDVGCGTGAFLNNIQQKGWDVTGLEPDVNAREVAQQLYDLQIQDIAFITELPKDSFDAITLWHVLEHVHKLHEFIQQLRTLLKDNGTLFIAVPNYQSLDSKIYGSHWAAYDVPRHLYHFSPKAMQVLLQKNGFTLKEKKPMWFDGFYISLLSSKYKSGYTNWFSAFVNGMRSNAQAVIDTDQCSSIIYVVKKN